MKIAIIGAGVSGLAAARHIQREGHEPVVFESSATIGGRVETRSLGPYKFDSGATSIAARGRSIGKVMHEELDATGLTRVERPIYVQVHGRIVPGDPAKNGIERWCYAQGINRLATLLAEGLDVRLNSRVDRVKEADGFVEVLGQQFDAAILSVPVPEAEELIATSGRSRSLANSRYRPCLSLLLAYDKPFDSAYHAVIDVDGVVPLTWLSVESSKMPGLRAPEGHTALVAQMSPDYSKWHFEESDEEILDDCLVDVARLIGKPFGEPIQSAVRRWKYSQPEGTVSFDTANPPGTKLIVAGDGVAGGRVELAYDAGIRAAQLATGQE